MDDSAYAFYRKGAALLSEGLAREAAEVLAQARDLEPERASIREALARAWYSIGHLRRAAEEFDSVTRIDPSNDYAHFGLALCLERQGRFFEARGHIRMASVMNPGNEEYQRALARIEALQ